MKIVLIFLLAFPAIASSAQNKTIKLYIKQIAANKVYIEYLQKGYRIVKGGLDFIGNLKKGHFNLDKDFFVLLENINPKIRNYQKVGDIISQNIAIIKQTNKIVNDLKTDELSNERERKYISQVFKSLETDCFTLTDELVMIISAAKVKMTDDERLSRINKIYDQMNDNYNFTFSFSGGIDKLRLQRVKELRDVKFVQKAIDVDRR